MPDFGFRMHFGGRAATTEELERVEEIVVEQEMDMAWEARIRMYLCLDENGHWQHAAQEFAQPFSRVRVELGAGTAFTPLIDGPVASYQTALDSQPGRSSVTLVVRDDSVLLNREERTRVFENRGDDVIAREVFGDFTDVIKSTRVESPGGARPAVTRRGTAIAFLRELAHAHQWHAYVLPGSAPGESVGCFLPDPATPGTLPVLVLIGADRSLTDVEITENSESPEVTRGHTLRISDQQIITSERSVRDLTLMRPLPPLTGTQPATRQLPPEDNDREEADARTLGQQRRSSYAYRLKGKVLPTCYTGILAPYQRVTVRVGTLPLSGEWLLTKVTHTITPNLYTQELEALADSAEQPAAADGAGGALGLSVSFSASLSLF